MNTREIEHMWKVASNNPNHDTNWHDPVIVAFAQLVAQKEREECAKMCDELHPGLATKRAAELIRARGQA